MNFLLRKGMTESAMSSWASPAVFELKKDKRIYFSANFIKINAIAKLDTYLLLWIEKGIGLLENAAMYSRADCNSEYWMAEISEMDRDRATFPSYHRLFQFIWMSFGLQYAPEPSQRAMETFPSELERQFALVFLGDIMVFSELVVEHLKHTGTAVELLRSFRMAMKWARSFFVGAALHLGSKIRPETLAVKSTSSKAVTKSLLITNRAGLGFFLNFAKVFSAFAPKFARTAPQLDVWKRPDYFFCVQAKRCRAQRVQTQKMADTSNHSGAISI